MTMPSRKFALLFALWDYLNQPLFDKDVRFVWNPLEFTVSYRTQLLERCWTRDYVIEKNRQQLELCWHNSATGNTLSDTGCSDSYD